MKVKTKIFKDLPTDEEVRRFESNFKKISIDSCWMWEGKSITNAGYGILGYRNKSISAHRLSWLVYKGHIENNLYVLHRCDNKLCVNPQHLYLGTQSNNVCDTLYRNKDKVNGYPSRFSQLEISEIKRLYASGVQQKVIAKQFECNRSYISKIVSGYARLLRTH